MKGRQALDQAAVERWAAFGAKQFIRDRHDTYAEGDRVIRGVKRYADGKLTTSIE